MVSERETARAILSGSKNPKLTVAARYARKRNPAPMKTKRGACEGPVAVFLTAICLNIAIEQQYGYQVLKLYFGMLSPEIV